MTSSEVFQNLVPKGKLATVIALIAMVVVGNAAWTGASAAVRTFSTDDAPITQVYQFEPPELVIHQGDPITVRYLYTKRACDAVATFSVYPENDTTQRAYNVGPYVASAPPAKNPRWLTVTSDIGSKFIPPGKYTLTYFMQGNCDGRDGERPSSKTLYQQGPKIPLTILPVANG